METVCFDTSAPAASLPAEFDTSDSEFDASPVTSVEPRLTIAQLRAEGAVQVAAQLAQLGMVASVQGEDGWFVPVVVDGAARVVCAVFAAVQ